MVIYAAIGLVYTNLATREWQPLGVSPIQTFLAAAGEDHNHNGVGTN
jgi:hypothetical protein